MDIQQILASPLVPLIMVFGIMYFLVIRPQRQQERRHQQMLKSLKKNDEVVTSCGIHGTIVNVKDNTVILRIDDNVKIEIEKATVAYIKKQDTDKSN
ncbi:MAG: preprotein translocase subunit YajC [Candidatus Omnitrophica bacterium]|nr:preprotein translocase subunit YajC [Candidatus Omnitrophota bacterium]